MSSTVVLAAGDSVLHEELTRLCAAAGLTPEVCRSYAELTHRWHEGDVVLLDAGLAGEVAEASLPANPRVHLVMRGTASPEQLRLAVQCRAEQIYELPAASQSLSSLLGDLADGQGQRGVVVGVTGGAGGAGASTFATALAQTAGRHGPALLIDLDPYGPGAGTLLGLSEAGEVGWEALANRGGRMAGKALRDSLPKRQGTSVLGWRSLPEDLPETTVREALDAGARGHELVVLDLPRHGPMPRDLSAHLDLIVMITRPDVSGLASASRSVAHWGARRCGVVVRGPQARTELVQGVAGAPVLTRMRDQRGVRDSVDLGFGPLRRPRGPLHDACFAILRAVDWRGAS